MRLFGVIRHSPDELIRALLQINKKPYFYFSAFGAALPLAGVPEKIVIIPSVIDFKRSYRALNTEAYSDKDVFVFGSELLLVEYTPIVFVDAEYNSDIEINPTGFIDIDLISKTKADKNIIVKRIQDLFVTSTINEALKNSVFNELMTFIYTLPAKTHQKPLTGLCCAYLRYNLTQRQFLNSLKKLRKEVSITERVETNLLRMITTESADRMRLAFTEIPSFDRDHIEEASVKYDVPAFELSYAIKTLENEKEYIKHTKESIDDRMRKKP